MGMGIVKLSLSSCPVFAWGARLLPRVRTRWSIGIARKRRDFLAFWSRLRHVRGSLRARWSGAAKAVRFASVPTNSYVERLSLDGRMRRRRLLRNLRVAVLLLLLLVLLLLKSIELLLYMLLPARCLLARLLRAFQGSRLAHVLIFLPRTV